MIERREMGGPNESSPGGAQVGPTSPLEKINYLVLAPLCALLENKMQHPPA